MKDAPITGYIDQVAQRIAQNSDAADKPVTVRVIRSRNVNAFTLPGGHI